MMSRTIKITLSALLAAMMLISLVACALPTESTQNNPTVAPISNVSETPKTTTVSAKENTADGFTVSRVFSSNMVIQRNEKLRVWGWADEGENGKTITVEFLGKKAEGKIENGEWAVTFDDTFDTNASFGNSMKIYTDRGSVELKDILVGDVYMVIGQSNVAYQMSAHCANTGANLSQYVNNSGSLIRLNYNTLNSTSGYPTRGTEEVCKDVVDGHGWTKANVGNVNGFTAIGYLFADEIVTRTEKKIPIGLIEIDGNGQPLGAFLPNEVAQSTGADSLKNGIFVPPGINGTASRYMYNHYMYPFENFAIAGIVWYQGESDSSVSSTYADKYVALMEYMRSTHNLTNPDFPVYIVEIPTVYAKPSGHTGEWHFIDYSSIRPAMGSIVLRLPNSYMAVSSDIFTDDTYYNNIHPDIKAPQAERLADLAGSVWYGLSELDEATGPILSSFDLSEDKKTATLKFTNVGDGLATSDGGTTVKGFVALGRNGAIDNSIAITAEITSTDTIVITSDGHITGVAYNAHYKNFYGKEINLCNSNGKIAAAFTYSVTQMNEQRYYIGGENGEFAALEEGKSLSVHFSAPESFKSVGVKLLKTTDDNASVTLSLYKFENGDRASEPIYSKAFENYTNYTFAELKYGRNIPAGEYVLVISNATNTQIKLGDTHESQRVWTEDAESIENMSLEFGISYTTLPSGEPYAIPTDPNAETEEPTTEQPTEQPTEDSSSQPDTEAPTDTTEEENTTSADVTAQGGCKSTLAASLTVVIIATLGVAVSRRKD